MSDDDWKDPVADAVAALIDLVDKHRHARLRSLLRRAREVVDWHVECSDEGPNDCGDEGCNRCALLREIDAELPAAGGAGETPATTQGDTDA